MAPPSANPRSADRKPRSRNWVRPKEILSEKDFRRMLSLEQKRSERAQRPFAILLMETGRPHSSENNILALLNILSVLQTATRETDLMGWYETNISVGVMFTEIMMDNDLSLSTILSRISAILREKLSAEQFGQIKFSCDLYPEELKRSLQVMKFGGTSVRDASCIRRVVEIVRTASRERSIAVVVSAMSGVTNQLIEAANQSKAGSQTAVAEIFGQLRKRHGEVATSLIHSEDEQHRLKAKLGDLFTEGERLCQASILLRELTPRTLDAISGLGERLCAPLVAAALSEAGVASEALDATDLVVTDSYYGAAEPQLNLTRARCQTRMTPLLKKGTVPVVTGFIGATEEGVLTTLGRGGSDYSATILGAALDADEVVIWTDVTGLLTADPNLVADACTISEISYREAAELAYFGAKVLHTKTFRPVKQSGIPIWIKNTFAADESGTKITPAGPRNARGIKAVTVIPDAALITVAGVGTQGGRKGVPDAWARTVATAAALRADVLLMSQSPSHNGICLVVASSPAKRTVEALRREFSPDLVRDRLEHTVFDATVSVITLVGENMGAASETVARALTALSDENVNIIATAQGSSDCSVAFVVPQQDMEIALSTVHRELELVDPPSNRRPVTVAARPSAIWKYQSEPASAD